MKEEIVALLRTEVSRMIERPEADIQDDSHFADLGMDSLQALQLLVLIERNYNLQISEEDLKLFTSVNAVAELVASRLELPATV